MVADINLDQLRPIFPLKILTMLAVDESTLGDTVKKVAAPMGIRIQPDPEPERNLLRRSDHYSFMQIGVPATGFIFGYEKGSPEEAVYRRWYAERYHSPADDLNQPWDPAGRRKVQRLLQSPGGRVGQCRRPAPLEARQRVREIRARPIGRRFRAARRASARRMPGGSRACSPKGLPHQLSPGGIRK